MPELKFIWIDDEECDIYLDRDFIISVNHGDHGWDGMVAVITALNSVAEVTGWKISVEGTPGV